MIGEWELEMIWKQVVVSHVSDWICDLEWQLDFLNTYNSLTANSYTILTDLHGLQISVTAARVKSPMSSIGVAR
jgi:hypothetical protein